MKYSTFLIVSLTILINFAITCIKDPASSDISDDLKPKGSITGWIYNNFGSPLKDVIVSIDSDSATPGVSDSSGKFTVGRILPGTYTLHFSHLDFEDNPSITVTVEQGVDDTLDETVYLSYRYFILKGKVTFGGSPVAMAGVVIDNLCMSTLTNSEGLYIFNKVLKEGEFKLISSKTDIGYGSISGIIGVPNDTTVVPDIELINEGGTVKGTVYDTLAKPVPYAIVHSVGGGLIDTADAEGAYTITNMPCHELNIPIYVPETNGLTGAVSGLDVDENSTLVGIDIYLHKASDYVNGMMIITSDILAPDTVTKVDISVIGLTDGSAYIVEYEWYLGGATSPDTVTQTSYFTLSIQRLIRSLSYESVNDTDILVEVRAKNNENLYSPKEKFNIMLRGSDPVITTSASLHPDSSGSDIITSKIGQVVYFKSSIIALFVGIDTLEWNFGDGTVKTISSDSFAVTPYSYQDTGLYNAVFRLKEINGREAKDTVVVDVDTGFSPPEIIVDPKPATVLIGQTATFGVIATGARPLSYQWIKITLINIIDTLFDVIPGANDSSYIIPATSINDSGSRFQCIVSNIAGADTSNKAMLIVSQSVIPPTITSEPQEQTVLVGETATFNVTATGTSPLSYQWFKNDTIISGAENSSYTTPATSLNDSGSLFQCIVSNVAGADTSNTAMLIVSQSVIPPTITSEPQPQTVFVGETATFSISVTGTPAFSYQWLKNDSLVSVVDDSDYTTPVTTLNDSGSLFHCIVSNSVGADTSNTALLIVSQNILPPTITSEPQPQTVFVGETATFSISVIGTPAFSYQWLKNDTIVSVVDDSDYTIPATTLNDSGSLFNCIVSNSAGADTSNYAVLSVEDTTSWTVYNTSNSSLPDNWVSSIAIDGSGNKWIGTHGGVAKFDGANWTMYNTINSGLPDNSVSSITIDSSGNKWIGTGSGVAKFDGTNWTVYNTINSSLPDNVVSSIALDFSGNKWIGTRLGLAKFDGTNWTVYDKSNSGLPANMVQSIAIDNAGIGCEWIGTADSGLAKFEETNWTVYNTSNSGLPNNRVCAIAIDGLGNTWIGTDGGITIFDGTNWTVYNSTNSDLPNNWVQSITIDNSRNKWIGTGGGGLAIFDE